MKIEARHIMGILRKGYVDIQRIGYTAASEYISDAINRDRDTRQNVNELQTEIDRVQEEFTDDMGRLDGEMAVLVKACPHTMFQIVTTNGMDIPICDICNGVVEEEVTGE